MTAAPANLDDLRHSIASATSPLRLAGGGSKQHPPTDPATTLSLSALAGITAYDPAECVLTALAGTRLADLVTTLGAHGQYLPFDPPLVERGATLGGAVATGWSGSSRYRYGGIRDFVIGARVVDGEGRLIASGGQVVKNAAGFLLHHAIVGSAGRLAVIADVSVKVFPEPASRVTLAARAPSLDSAIAAHERVRAANLDLDALDLDASATTVWVRLAGADDALPARVDLARRHLDLPVEVLRDAAERDAWAAGAMHDLARASIVKVPSAPSRLGAMLAVLQPFGHCRVSVGAAALYLSTGAPLADVERTLAEHGWRAAVVRGRDLGGPRGATEPDAFDARLRRTLDPHGRFC